LHPKLRVSVPARASGLSLPSLLDNPPVNRSLLFVVDSEQLSSGVCYAVTLPLWNEPLVSTDDAADIEVYVATQDSDITILVGVVCFWFASKSAHIVLL